MGLGAAPRAADYEVVWDGPAAAIRLAPDPLAAYRLAIGGADEISTKRNAHLKRYFREFCDHREFYKRLNSEQFKREDTLKDGRGGVVPVWTFKAWKWRLYGSIIAINGKPCFVGMRVDASKKQNKANQKLLKATAKDIGSLAEYRSRG
jgi:hypothetical protein